MKKPLLLKNVKKLAKVNLPFYSVRSVVTVSLFLYDCLCKQVPNHMSVFDCI